MEESKLLQAVEAMIRAESEQDKFDVFSQNPLISSRQSIEKIRHLAQSARESGNAQKAEEYEQVADFLSHMQQTGYESIESGALVKEYGPFAAESPIAWIRTLRQYFALRYSNLLDQAIEEAENSDAGEVAELLKLRRKIANDPEPANDPEAAGAAFAEEFIGVLGKLQAAERFEEFVIVSLCAVDLETELIRHYDELPLETQASTLEAGIKACKAALGLARELGDQGCMAFYQMTLAGAYHQLERSEEALALFSEALALLQTLAQQQPDLFQPKLAQALCAFGILLSNSNYWVDAEELIKQGITIYRQLGEKRAGAYQYSLAFQLNNLSNLYSDMRRFTEAEQASRESLQMFEQLEEKNPQRYIDDIGATLLNLGRLLWMSGRLNEAEEVARKAVEIHRKLADAEPQTYLSPLAKGISNLAAVLLKRRRFEEAEIYFKEATDIFTLLKNVQPQLYGTEIIAVMATHSGLLVETKRFDEALQILEEIISTLRNLVLINPSLYEPNMAIALMNLGATLVTSRRLKEAEPVLRECAELFQKLNYGSPQVYEPNLGLAFNNLVFLFMQQRRWQEAEEYCQKSLQLYRNLAITHPTIYDSETVLILINYGTVLWSLNRLHEARNCYEEALVIQKRLLEVNPETYEPEMAMTLTNLGNVLTDMSRFDSAEKRYREGLQLYRKLATAKPSIYQPGLAMALNNLGNLLINRERIKEAEELSIEALNIYKNLAQYYPDIYTQELAKPLYNLASALLSSERFAEAENVLIEALEISRNYDLPDIKAIALSRLGQLKMRTEQWLEAIEMFYEAKDEIERLRLEVPSLHRRKEILRDNLEIYEHLMVCLLKVGRQAEALEIVEGGKNRTIIDLLKLRDLPPKNAPVELVQSYEQVTVQMYDLEDRLSRIQATGTDAEGGAPMEIESFLQEHIRDLSRLLEEARSLRDSLTKEISSIDADFPVYSETLTGEMIQSLAKETGDILLLIQVFNGGSSIFIVFPEGDIEIISEPHVNLDSVGELLFGDLQSSELGGWIGSYANYRDMPDTADEMAKDQARQAWQEQMDGTLHNLYNLLLKNAHLVIRERIGMAGQPLKNLVIVPSRGLNWLPLHACWWYENNEKRYLLDDFVITYVPSFSVYKRCVERERLVSEKDSTLIIGDPLRDLTFSRFECEEIERSRSGHSTQILWHDKAVKNEVIEKADAYHVLHFSCHGEYMPNAPMESYLSLAGQVRLTLGEILKEMNLQKGWLTCLSACETGLTDLWDRADESFGLPFGFLFAGMPTVWSTLWIVDDLTTGLFIAKAYEELAGKDKRKPESLREAQIWLRDISARELGLLLRQKENEWHAGGKDWVTLREFWRRVRYCYDGDDRPFAHPYYWSALQCIGV